MTIEVSINGESVKLDASDIAGILELRGIDAEKGGVAVAVNGEVVPRGDWDQTMINSDDRIEIVHIVRGG